MPLLQESVPRRYRYALHSSKTPTLPNARTDRSHHHSCATTNIGAEIEVCDCHPTSHPPVPLPYYLLGEATSLGILSGSYSPPRGHPYSEGLMELISRMLIKEVPARADIREVAACIDALTRGLALPERPAARLEAAVAAEQAEIELNKRRQANAEARQSQYGRWEQAMHDERLPECASARPRDRATAQPRDRPRSLASPVATLHDVSAHSSPLLRPPPGQIQIARAQEGQPQLSSRAPHDDAWGCAPAGCCARRRARRRTCSVRR